MTTPVFIAIFLPISIFLLVFCGTYIALSVVEHIKLRKEYISDPPKQIEYIPYRWLDSPLEDFEYLEYQ